MTSNGPNERKGSHTLNGFDASKASLAINGGDGRLRTVSGEWTNAGDRRVGLFASEACNPAIDPIACIGRAGATGSDALFWRDVLNRPNRTLA